MFDHVTIRVRDREASERFYNAVLAQLGIDQTYQLRTFSEWQDFSLAGAEAGDPVTRRLHVGFVAPSREQVAAFWRAGLDAGYTDAGAPGPRPEYLPDYYGAFLADPDGNSIEAVHHGDLRRDGVIDHLWVRVNDLSASRRFYATIAPAAGLSMTREHPDRITLEGTSGSLSLVAGEPTAELHLAFGTGEDAAVDAFHAAATAGGFRSNGAPGERPQYHRGYYAAYVLDPDGNNVELVNHHR